MSSYHHIHVQVPIYMEWKPPFLVIDNYKRILKKAHLYAALGHLIPINIISVALRRILCINSVASSCFLLWLMEKSDPPESNGSQATSSSSSSSCKYKGVRWRKWGKYVSEIRLPNSRQRIWLGSYDSAVEAAKAFDAAQFCLRGPSANFNFPDNLPDIPGGRSLTPSQIQVEAARFAHSDPPSANSANQADAPSGSTSNVTDRAVVDTEEESSLLDEFRRTVSWESEKVSEYGYFQGFDDFQNELFLSGPNYYVDDKVDETSDELWNF